MARRLTRRIVRRTGTIRRNTRPLAVLRVADRACIGLEPGQRWAYASSRPVRFATTGRVSPDWGRIESSSPSKALGPRRRSSSILGGPMALARRRSVTSSLERQRSVAEPLPWLKSLEAVAVQRLQFPN